MLALCFLFLAVVTKDGCTQESEGVYKGKYIGDLNTYANQVSGEVYAVDEWTLMMVNFIYNGEGRDTYFWAGESGRSGPQGFIVPNEYGITNILERYNGTSDFTLTLPEGKRIERIKWLAVFDIDSQNVFGDVYIPEGFDAPQPRTVGALAGSTAVSSGPLVFTDAKTVIIPDFRYDGSGSEVYFWTGEGAQPSARGTAVPDEHGYLEPIRAYSGENVTLQLPGELTVFRVQWLALWDAAAGAPLASSAVPDDLNVPAPVLQLHPYRSALPHCKQLHRDYQVSWEVYGNQITIQLAAQIEEDDYMAFGISGSPDEAQMVGADVAVASFDRYQQRGLAADYNITDMAPCVQVLGQWRGVCRDTVLGAQDALQVLAAQRDAGLTQVTYRRTLQPGEPGDLEFPLERELQAVWALGALDAGGEPSYHRAYNKRPLRLALAANRTHDDCFPFTAGRRGRAAAWDTAALTDPALRVFTFAVGPAGGARGVAGRAGRRAAPELAWYVNGQLAPDLQLRRGLRYSLRARGGADPHSARLYHPLVVTRAAPGAAAALGAVEREAAALAGLAVTRRGRAVPAPPAAGPLCAARASADRRREDDFASFRAYNRSLVWDCPAPPAADAPELLVTPNASWPDIVYYDSFTTPGMGGRIFIVDRSQRSIGRGAAPPRAPAPAALLLALTVLVSITSLTSLTSLSSLTSLASLTSLVQL